MSSSAATTSRDIEFVGRLRRRRRARSAATCPRPSSRAPNNTHPLRRRAADSGVERPPRPDPRRARPATCAAIVEESDGAAGRRRRVRCARRGTDVLVSYLPVGSRAGGDAGTPSRRSRPAAPSSTASPSSSPRTPAGASASTSAAADHRRRHQVPGRRHDRPPHAGQPVPRARRPARPHLPAELRRQHRLPEHAGARAAANRRRSPRPTPSRASSTTTLPADGRRMSARATTCRG